MHDKLDLSGTDCNCPKLFQGEVIEGNRGISKYEKESVLKSKNHLPGLDAIRMIAALIVMLLHIDQYIHSFSESMFTSRSDFGAQGFAVTIFFVLSGFLITLLLLSEIKANARVNVKKFYMRRIMKIWPLYFLIIAITFVVSILFGDYFWHSDNHDYIYYLLLAGNVGYVSYHTITPIIPFWSIGVEEQFYLFWPFLVKGERVLKSLLIFFGLFCLLKVGLRILVPGSIMHRLILETRFSCMAIGGIGAVLYSNPYYNVLKLLYNKYLQIISWIIFGSLIITRPYNVALTLTHELYALFFLVIILNISTNATSLIRLDGRLFAYLGKISYGIYCWHTLVIMLLVPFIRPYQLSNTWYNRLLIFFIVISVTLIMSSLSFKYYESYFLKNKRRFASVIS